MTIITSGIWPISPSVTTGTDLATYLNELVLAINSSQASASRPPMIAKGGVWAKTAGATDIAIMFFDGAVDHEIGSVVGGVAKFGGATFNSGATATKPAAPVKGDMFFDTTLNRLEVYDGGAWKFDVINIATAAEAQAFTNDTHIVTPLKLSDAFKGANSNVAASGYQKLPSGLIIQWGNIDMPSGATHHIFTLPVAFPVAAFSICITHAASAANRVVAVGGNPFITNAEAWLLTGSAVGVTSIYWIATGH